MMSCCSGSNSDKLGGKAEMQNARPPPQLPKEPVAAQPGMHPLPALFQPTPAWAPNPAMSPPPASELSLGPPASPFGAMTFGGSERPSTMYDAGTPAPGFAQAVATEGRMSVAVDFGTTFSGVAYGSSRLNGGRIQQILSWPGSSENFRKIPTCIVYSERGDVLAWGIEAKNAPDSPGMIKCEWFKLFLEPKTLRDDSQLDARLPRLPPGKAAADVIADFLGCLWTYAREQITRDIGAVADLDAAAVWLTVPAAWDARGCELMREAALSAGLVASARAGEVGWRERLRIITEPEAAAVHCAALTSLHKLSAAQRFVLCDAGGGTVDLAAYRVTGATAALEIAEIASRSGSNCGSLFLDLRFRALLDRLLEHHPGHTEPASMASFMNAFGEQKANFRGEVDDDNMFYFTCFNVLPDDPSVGLVNGELAIPGHRLRREVFEPVVDQVIQLLEEQVAKVAAKVDALLLVGGFAGSDYLFGRIQERFGPRVPVIARPFDADTATLRGAARYGLSAGAGVVASIVVPRSYMMKVKLPAEKHDLLMRPAYITTNDSGIQVCANRVEYLVMKGAILRRGQRVVTKLCKFSATSQDRVFVATLFVSDVDAQMRYTDEGETTELCQWHVDIGNLPSFVQHAAESGGRGFYTEFEIGLEVDSVEVRGMLLYQGQPWGSVVFDYRT